jgi:hypothetical protein
LLTLKAIFANNLSAEDADTVASSAERIPQHRVVSPPRRKDAQREFVSAEPLGLEPTSDPSLSLCPKRSDFPTSFAVTIAT